MFVDHARRLLDDARGRTLSPAELKTQTVSLAGSLLEAVEHEKTAVERKHAALLARLMMDRDGQVFTTLLTDRVYRSAASERVVDQARYLLRAIGIPQYLPIVARAQLQLLLRAGPFLPEPAARGVLRELREQTKGVVFSSEPSALGKHLALRRDAGVHVNLNQLGEAVLGEREASHKLHQYLGLLARPDVEAISIKLSSIASRVDLVPYAQTLEELRPRLRSVYRAALDHQYLRADGSRVAKLVSMDMEAYRDLQLTFELFTGVLDEPELLPLRACIVLQAYLPDSSSLQEELTRWAAQRVARGGAPVRLRIVKGANLAAERIESAARGWALPIYGSKLEVDASYKRMVEHATRPEHASVVQLGIASHNLFDVAYGLLLRESRGVGAHVGFELLEGMADPLRRVLGALVDDVLLYCPVVDDASMQTAIAYLLRRLDENTAEENFLRNSFGMQRASASFHEEQARFERALDLSTTVSTEPLRAQDRRVEERDVRADVFANEADTDFALARNRDWLRQCLASVHERPSFEVPLQIGGVRRFGPHHAEGFDPSRPGLVPYRFAQATPEELEVALVTAQRAARTCADTPWQERVGWLRAIAAGLRAHRGELIGTMVLDAGKRVDQADVEISEAIDFAEYYARSYPEHTGRSELRLSPKGVVLVTPPWNFPLAIPAGGVFAALVTGNAVLLKPATETVLVGERLADVCWNAGVPLEILQLLLCEDEVASRLVRDERVSTIVLTGATATARLFQTLRPGVDLLAETGGKNAIVVTAAADRDQAIKDVLQSAFGHAGQKCSAASLLICEAEVYDDATFMRTLEDAAASLPVGSAWDLRSVVTPLIRPPTAALARALTTLEPGESWLVQPSAHPDNPRLLGPGIKLGVDAASFTHMTELFGPVLGVMRARDLEHAIALVNATPYGLTSGLCSLDEREQLRWAEHVVAGNLYVNRGITGAIVQRQPFGGHKGSSFGPGAKAGGPNYLLQLCRIEDGTLSSELDPPHPNAATFLAYLKRCVDAADHRRLATAACVYQHAMRSYFAKAHDPSRVLGELNLLRYQPSSPLVVRLSADGVVGDALLACLAGLSANVQLILSVAPKVAQDVPWLTALPLVTCAVESAEACALRLTEPESKVARLRAIGTVEPELARAAYAANVHIAREPVLLAARVELLHYLREQSLTVAYQRNGYCEGKRLLPWVASD